MNDQGHGIEVDALHKDYRVHKRRPAWRPRCARCSGATYETVHAVRGPLLRDRARRARRVPRPQRRGQDDHPQDALRPAPPDGGRGRASTGTCRSARETAFLKKITLVMGQKQQLLWDLPPAETFELNRAIYDVPRARVRARRWPSSTSCSSSATLVAEADAPALARRADEVRAGGGAPAPAARCSSSTSRRSASTSRCRSPCASSSAATTSAPAPRCSSTATTWTTWPRSARASSSSTRAGSATTATFDALVQPIRPEKRIVLRYSRAPDRADSSALGTVVALDGGAGRACRSRSAQAARGRGHLLVGRRRHDLTVEDPPLEEVMRELFAVRARSRRGARA